MRHSQKIQNEIIRSNVVLHATLFVQAPPTNTVVADVKTDIFVPLHTHSLDSLTGLYGDHLQQYLTAERGTDLFNTLIEGAVLPQIVDGIPLATNTTPGAVPSFDAPYQELRVKANGNELEWISPENVLFTYNPNGSVNTKTVGTIVYTFAYNVNEDVESISSAISTKNFSYDLDGNLEEIYFT